ncbi:MAG: hypothetical protein FH748_09010 [Balneolaceae bacterium]|nr:hypothetical protein [Balneolaceae bacterium]
MSNYIAVLDREHLENKIFMTAFAKSVANLSTHKGIIIHGDSEYTERLIQTGMMRKDARERAIKDLNRRLVGLLADQGVPTVGIHGYQKDLVVQKEASLHLDTNQLSNLPDVPCILISSLASNNNGSSYVSIPAFASLFSESLEDFKLVLFSANEKAEIFISNNNSSLKWNELDQDAKETSIPEEFREFQKPAILATATDFSNWPNLKNMTRLS